VQGCELPSAPVPCWDAPLPRRPFSPYSYPQNAPQPSEPAHVTYKTGRRHQCDEIFLCPVHSSADVGYLLANLKTNVFLPPNTPLGSEAPASVSLSLPSVTSGDHQGYFFASPSTFASSLFGCHIPHCPLLRGLCTEHAPYSFTNIFHNPVNLVEGEDCQLE
jgi:hypothetical protein